MKKHLVRGVLSREPPRMLLESLGGYHFQAVSEISCEFSWPLETAGDPA